MAKLHLGNLAITSPAFKQGGPIPAEHAGDGADESPELSWQAVPGLVAMDVVIDFVLTSPLVRARETAQILAAGLKPKPAITELRTIPMTPTP